MSGIVFAKPKISAKYFGAFSSLSPVFDMNAVSGHTQSQSSSIIYQANVWAGCVNIESSAIDVAFDSEVNAEAGVVYLSLIGGDTPMPNDCGLNPSNDAAEWTGWGGPLENDNASIGEGPGTRNFITIAGVRYERGIGTHGAAKLVYDLTGGDYIKFKAVGGVDDEKTCGTVQFVFSVDDTQMADTGVLSHDDAAGAEVEFDIPAGAKELLIDVQDAGDGIGCDHADLGAAMLIPENLIVVSPKGRLAATWASIKSK